MFGKEKFLGITYVNTILSYMGIVKFIILLCCADFTFSPFVIWGKVPMSLKIVPQTQTFHLTWSSQSILYV